jgi:16S rRNA U516 pseudouridylate synthase RsuA-like enzyme
MCCTTTIKKKKTKRTKDNQKWVYMWIMEDRKRGVTRMTLITTEEHR